MAEPSLTAQLQERVSRQPDAAAYTFIDYEVDPNGIRRGPYVGAGPP